MHDWLKYKISYKYMKKHIKFGDFQLFFSAIVAV